MRTSPIAPADEASKYLGRLIEVKADHRIDDGALERFLLGAIEGFRGPVRLRQFESGQSNLTYLLQTPGGEYVLRRKPAGNLVKSAHAVDREYRVMRALSQQGFPVPRVYALCADETVLGTMFYVMDHVPGRIFLDCSMPDLGREERAEVYDSVNATLARLHRIDPAAIGLEDFGRAGNYFARQIARWTKQYEAAKSEDIAEMDRLMAWLPTAIPSDEMSRLVHGDFSFHNIVIHPTEPRVAAVLDWELSTLGHPMGDLMYHMMEWYRPEGCDPRGTLAGRDLPALGIPDFDTYLKTYCDRCGIAPPASSAFYRAYNLFRMAAIKQAIAGRLRDGTVVSTNAAEIGSHVRPLAQAAWSEAQRAGAES